MYGGVNNDVMNNRCDYDYRDRLSLYRGVNNDVRMTIVVIIINAEFVRWCK